MRTILFSFVLLIVVHHGNFTFHENFLVQRIQQTTIRDNHLNDLTSGCRKDLDTFIYRLKDEQNQDLWAIEMLDASSKAPTDALSYKYGDVGHFKQCTEIKSFIDGIQGKYCLGKVNINDTAVDSYTNELQNKQLQTIARRLNGEVRLNFIPMWAMCIPHSCSDNDAVILMTEIQPLEFSINSVICQTMEDVYPQLSSDAVLGISVFSILAIVVIVSTAYDRYSQNKTNVHPVYTAFSVYKNGRSLMRLPQRKTNLSCLDGIRVLSMLWVMSYHTLFINLVGLLFNPNDISTLIKSFLGVMICTGDFACDTFLIVSGTLVTYVYFKKGSENLTIFGVFKHYVHRLFRITPALAGLILVYSTFLSYIGSGPLWPEVKNRSENACKEYWWSTLFFIQNLLDLDTMCLVHGWYLAVDMQLYIFSPLIFWILSRHNKTGIAVISIAALSSMLLVFFKALENELATLHTNPDMKIPKIEFNRFYIKTEKRASPWLFGTILGYILTKKRFTSICLPKKIAGPIWLLCFSTIILCIFGESDALKTTQYHRFVNAVYVAFTRPAFSIAVAWIIWACCTNNGGIINKLLSLKLFQYFNQYTYTMYVIHVMVLCTIVYANKTVLALNLFNLAYGFWGMFLISFGLSIIWLLLIEKPMINIEQIIFHPKSETKSKEHPETITTANPDTCCETARNVDSLTVTEINTTSI